MILDETMSKEPLGPVVRDGDDDWADAVNWAVYATIQAEEFGHHVGQRRARRERGSRDPALPGRGRSKGEPFDAGLGLPDDFAVQVVTPVGNYGEIYDRNVGPGSALELRATSTRCGRTAGCSSRRRTARPSAGGDGGLSRRPLTAPP